MAKQSPASTKRISSSIDFPIVGIGCSAGGLEALEAFFRQVPADCGMAFVVIQHLDPRHASTLPALIARAAHLPVKEAKNRMKVQPNTVYVIPPNRDLSLLHDSLHLLEPAPSTGLRLPVDFFLRSLAEDRQERAVGVILSGMGCSDGSLGLRAIKEKAGLVLVQDPAEARSAGMPKSAIDAGLADIVAPAAELPGRIAAFLRQAPHPAGAEPVAAAALSTLEKIVILLRNRQGVDSPNTRPAHSTAASSGAPPCTSYTASPTTCATCARTRRSWTCCSRNC